MGDVGEKKLNCEIIQADNKDIVVKLTNRAAKDVRKLEEEHGRRFIRPGNICITHIENGRVLLVAY